MFEKRQPLELLAPLIFPILESLATKFMSNYIEQSAMTLNTVFETFIAAVKMGMPKYFYDTEKIKTWMVIVKTILSSKIPQ